MKEYQQPIKSTEYPKGIFVNRELSWLEFNKRVLYQSLDESVPLMERLKFLAIYFSNLDEFFMVRVGSLTDQSIIEPELLDDKTGFNAAEQINAILKEVRQITPIAEEAYQSICQHLVLNDVDIIDVHKLSKMEEVMVHQHFNEEIKPLLSPQVVDRHHPFPFLKNKEQFIATVFETKGDNKDFRMGIVPISHLPPYFIFNINERRKVLFTSEIVCHFAHKLYNHQKIQEKNVLRVTRNADITVDEGLFDYDIDFRGVMQVMLKKRRRLDVVRVQFSAQPSDKLAKHICQRLKVSSDKLMIQNTPLDFGMGFSLGTALNAQMNRKDWFYKEVRPSIAIDFSKKNAIDYLSEKDLLLSFPFHSTKPFVDLLYEAADDPEVISIKISLYRLANHSKIAAALAHAAEKGKEVLCALELRARFDEQNNINYATMLEDAGCTVIYGLSDYKVHAKLCLITRKTHQKISYIIQVGTGNYNEKTSELYTDLSLITSDQQIGEDATKVFQALCMGEVVDSAQSLWVAPNCFETNILSCIEEEIQIARDGGEGYIFLKINSFNDMEIMQKLIEASQAGVVINMCVRGICCICPHVPGYTDNITIHSIVGRYLEHSRLFVFGKAARERIYMGSGDLLNRNTRRRVEVFTEIKKENTKNDIHKMIEVIWLDNCNSWEMLSDGSYQRVTNQLQETLDSHTYLHQYFSVPLAPPPPPPPKKPARRSNRKSRSSRKK